MKGVVIKSTGSWYTVLNESGTIVECGIKGKFRIQGIKTTNPIAVGDKVAFEMENDGRGVIHAIEDRKNYIIRKSSNLSKQSHISAAHMDMMSELDGFISVYQKIGYQCYKVSATEKTDINLLKELTKDKITLVSGHSGVGKSTLVNAMDFNLDLTVGEISDAHFKGKHTTTFAEMHQLTYGGFIIDTPGIKELGLVNMEKEEISNYFPEMRALKNQCKFNNCVHLNEPKCAVIEAVEQGEIAQSRYNSYIGIMNGEELNIPH
ncbi:MAG: ribosome small subunit-dependent GTPase A [Bacteroidetes bacterium]|nr:ribosome small subunit-dependent GTPase A [Bacteroidota bacterium]